MSGDYRVRVIGAYFGKFGEVLGSRLIEMQVVPEDEMQLKINGRVTRFLIDEDRPLRWDADDECLVVYVEAFDPEWFESSSESSFEWIVDWFTGNGWEIEFCLDKENRIDPKDSA